MKSGLMTVLAVMIALVAAPAMAGDGAVSQDTLSALGLGGMQVVSDAEGAQVRGMSSRTAASGHSLVFGQLTDGNGNFAVASGVEAASSSNFSLFSPSFSSQRNSQITGAALNTGGGTSFFIGGSFGRSSAFAF